MVLLLVNHARAVMSRKVLIEIRGRSPNRGSLETPVLGNAPKIKLRIRRGILLSRSLQEIEPKSSLDYK